MLIKLLVESGADVLKESNEGLSSVWLSCAYNQKEVIKLFFEHGVSPNYTKPSINIGGDVGNYLDWLTTTKDLSIESSFNLDASRIFGGESLLHVAVKNGHISMVKLLLESEAEGDAQDDLGNAALHYAAVSGKKDIVKYLLDNGVNRELVNSKDQKAIDYSNAKGFNEITELLLSS